MHSVIGLTEKASLLNVPPSQDIFVKVLSFEASKKAANCEYKKRNIILF